MLKNIARFVIAILLCEGAGILGSVVTFPAITSWYTTLQKPFFNPPNWIFGPVWTILFFFMGIALALVWGAKAKKREAIVLFVLQLILNVLWSLLFFGLQSPLLALVEIVLLWLAIYFTIKAFFKVSSVAGYLLIPYLIWVSFASILNFAIVLLN